MTLTYVAKVMTLSNFQQVLVVARYSIKSYYKKNVENDVSFLLCKTKIFRFKIYLHTKRILSPVKEHLTLHVE